MIDGLASSMEAIVNNSTNEPVSPRTRRVMQGNRSKNTGPEVMLRRALWLAGVRGYRLHRLDLPGKPDLTFGRKKLVVFIHGCFWHGCPVCNRSASKTRPEFWSEKIAKNQERDRKSEATLRSLGFEVVTIWECEVKRTLEAAVQRIKAALVPSANELDSRLRPKCGASDDEG